MFVLLNQNGKYQWTDVECNEPYPRSGVVRAVCRCQGIIEWKDGMWTHVDTYRTHAQLDHAPNH